MANVSLPANRPAPHCRHPNLSSGRTTVRSVPTSTERMRTGSVTRCRIFRRGPPPRSYRHRTALSPILRPLLHGFRTRIRFNTFETEPTKNRPRCSRHARPFPSLRLRLRLSSPVASTDRRGGPPSPARLRWRHSDTALPPGTTLSSPRTRFHRLRHPRCLNLVYQKHPLRRSRSAPKRMRYYQLAFFTPGIRPAEAISRNWIRLMPNRRI